MGTVCWGCGLGLLGAWAVSGDPPCLAGGPYPYLGFISEGAEVRVLAPGHSERKWGWGLRQVPPCGEQPQGAGEEQVSEDLEAGGRAGCRVVTRLAPILLLFGCPRPLGRGATPV